MSRNKKGQFIDGEDGKRTQFALGQEPWNKGKHFAPAGSEKGHFKKGNLGPATKPEGTITRYERTKNGRREVVYTINIDWHGKRKPHNSYKWYLWEVENQEDRPKGKVLYVKNGDPDDMRIENFEVIDRSELLRRNAPHYV